MKPNRKYTLLGHTVEVTPGGGTAWAARPGGERREFHSIPGGATAEVQSHWWIHGIHQPAESKTQVKASAKDEK